MNECFAQRTNGVWAGREASFLESLHRSGVNWGSHEKSPPPLPREWYDLKKY